MTLLATSLFAGAAPSSKLTPSVNASARPQNRCCNVDVFADALYWRATETVDWGYPLVLGTNTETAHFKTIHFHWDPGYRVGAGYNMKHDRWDTQLYYTRFHTKTSAHAEAGSNAFLVSAFMGNKIASGGLFTYQRAKIHWKIHFDMLDWDLGRTYFISKRISLRPLIGVKGGWINQTIHTDWRNSNYLNLGIVIDSEENLKNNFRGVGPKGGVNTKWILNEPTHYFFSIFGDFALAYMWGEWKIRDNYSDNFNNHVAVVVGKRRMGSFVVQGFMGLSFDVNFRKDLSHFAVKLGYEIQDWLNQFQVLDNTAGAQNCDLIFQGATLDLRIDF
jgi:hypothetical protein